jgi:hypothetical protein
MRDLLARHLLPSRRDALSTHDQFWMTHRATRP